MSRNRIVEAFWTDINVFGIPNVPRAIAEHAETWANALEADPEEWDGVDGEIREAITEAIGIPANSDEVDAYMARAAAMTVEALVELRKMANA